MSTVSFDVKDGNPVTLDVLNNLAQTHLGVKIAEKDQEDYLKLLKALHDSVGEVLALPDYIPTADLERFPRKNAHKPIPEENKLNGFVWNVEVEDSQPNEGPLKGKTIVLKDNYCVAGVPCGNGSYTHADWVPKLDAETVTRILKAGGKIIGKATTENNSGCPNSFSSASGPVQNPYAWGRTTGGSSSGTACLVANGDADMGMGADQGGSIRMPAAFCGIVGLKPTMGLVPFTGIVSLDYVIDHAGPMTKTVYDNALLLSVVAGADGVDDRQGPGVPFPADVPKYHDILTANKEKGVKGMKIGILKEAYEFANVDPRITAKIKSAAEKLQSLGAIVEEVSIPLHKSAPVIWATSMRISSAMSLKGLQTGRKQLYLNDLSEIKYPWTQKSFDETYPTIPNLVIGGTYCLETFGPGIYGKAMNLVQQLQDLYDEKLSEYDALLLPTVPYVANTHAQQTDGPIAKISKSLGQNLNTGIFNSTGHPGLAVPCGMLPAKDGEPDEDVLLPVSMQLVGKYFSEQKLYQIASTFEDAFDWKKL